MVALILLGAALRAPLLTQNRLHPDEALFATLARLIANGDDPWLIHTPLLVDKPPLFYYMLVAGLSISWGSELTLRLPGFFASLVSLALAARLAWQMWRSTVAVLVTLVFYALSPFAILFAPTAFTDPQLVMWLLAALGAVCSGQWGWSGVMFGCALATKQSALFYAPLVLALGVVQAVEDRTSWPNVWRWILRFALGLSLVIALITFWDLARQGVTSFWSAGLQANNPGRLIRSNELWPRLHTWLGWLSIFVGYGWPGLAMLLCMLFALPLIEITTRRQTREAAATLVLLAFLLSYVAFLWLVAFPILDRYLLPLVPLVASLLGRTSSLVAQCTRLKPISVPRSIILVVAMMLTWPAWKASHSAYPIGGDHGAYDGIDQVADYLCKLPEGTVVYYETLGWPLHYYLFDASLYLAHYISPADLAADLEAFGSDGSVLRYLVLPGWESHVEVLDAIVSSGYRAEVLLETTGRGGDKTFIVYQIRNPGGKQ